MNLFDASQPVGYVLAVLGVAPGQRRDDRGASTVEWVLIAALVVAITITVAGFLREALTSEAQDVGNKIKGA